MKACASPSPKALPRLFPSPSPALSRLLRSRLALKDIGVAELAIEAATALKRAIRITRILDAQHMMTRTVSARAVTDLDVEALGCVCVIALLQLVAHAGACRIALHATLKLAVVPQAVARATARVTTCAFGSDVKPSIATLAGAGHARDNARDVDPYTLTAFDREPNIRRHLERLHEVIRLAFALTHVALRSGLPVVHRLRSGRARITQGARHPSIALVRMRPAIDPGVLHRLHISVQHPGRSVRSTLCGTKLPCLVSAPARE